MQCYTELTPPTAVTHSISLPLLSAQSKNLVVAKTSLLQIFTTKVVSAGLDPALTIDDDDPESPFVVGSRVRQEDDDLQVGAEPVLMRPESTNVTKLVLVAEYKLSGTITSLARIKINQSKSGGDALLVSFKDAKLSLVEWDPERRGLSTISIHYYEQDDLQESPWAPSLSNCVNYLSADPGSRCAAFKFGTRNLAILPFRQGDEDVQMDEDWNDELDGPRPVKEAVSSKPMNGATDETPYSSSFVLRMPALDPSLLHPIHLSFLHEYREPTFGILSSTVSSSSALIHERRDHLTYVVFTLDLNQKASTTILSVGNLPSDLTTVIPLPAPVGGAILLGINDLIHVDQGGKATGVAVNLFAKQCTSFSLMEQSDLDLRLEGCKLEQLSTETGEMLMILHDGQLAILSFRMDGRSVSGLNIRRLSDDLGLSSLSSRASSTTYLGPGYMFIGSEDADSVLLGWSKKSGSTSHQARVEMADGVDDDLVEEEDDDVDDDLYGEAPSRVQTTKRDIFENSKSSEYVFRKHDTLINIASIKDITLGKPFLPPNTKRSHGPNVVSDLELIAAVDRDQAGALALITQDIQPKIIGRFEFPEARGVWTMRSKKPLQKGMEVTKEKPTMTSGYGVNAQYDKFMIVSKADNDAVESSDVYALTSAGFESLTGTEFDGAAGSTIEAGMLGDGMRIIQVLKSEVRSYDGDLGLAQILPMSDEDTGVEPSIISASFADPFLLLTKDDSSIFVAQCDDNNELEEIEREDDKLIATKWLSGCLYTDTTATFANIQDDKGVTLGDNVFMFLLSAEGALHIYKLPDLAMAVYVVEGVYHVPPVLSPGYTVRRAAARETLTEILVADLGDFVSRSPYLILRSSNDDLTIYEPFRTGLSTGSDSPNIHFLKMGNSHLATNPAIAAQETVDNTQDTTDKPMRAIQNLSGYSTIFLPGGSPSFVIKSSKSLPRVVNLRGNGVRGMSSFHTEGCDRGFIYVDTAGVARVSQLPADTNFTELGVPVTKMTLGQTIHAVSYHAPSQTCIVGASTMTQFELPKDDDHHHQWQKDDISFLPSTERSLVKLLSLVNGSVIDSLELEPFEIITCVKTLNLEVSETTHERKHLIVVGTAIVRGEDLAARGRLYVYDVVSVVPEPDRPETDKKLKLIAKEDIARGAVTAVSEIGTQGFMLVAQGQKCMVRGLKEDCTLLPLAFMDMDCLVTSAKELRGTGFCVMGDVLKGVWFTGYTEEPYRMLLFGKTNTKMEVVATEFLPDGKELYIVVGDADCNLHIMQFDPEHPKSLQGHLLLHRTTFSLGGHIPSTMTLLPRTTAPTMLAPSPDAMDTAADATIPEAEILITSSTGSLALLSPLSEAQYRRLSTLASHLTNTLHHPCGLNPRAYRHSKDAPEGMVGARTVVDGGMLLRWSELGSQRRAEVAGRAGMDVDEVREDLAALMGGLRYL